MATHNDWDSYANKIGEHSVYYTKVAGLVARRLFLEAGRRLILRTPVDEGTLRASWRPSLGSPDTSQTGGGEGMAKAAAMLKSITGNELIYWTNPLPYAIVIEEGRYPDPPKNPTGKTQGGFSVQAPQGMVAPTLQELKELVKAMGIQGLVANIGSGSQP